MNPGVPGCREDGFSVPHGSNTMSCICSAGFRCDTLASSILYCVLSVRISVLCSVLCCANTDYASPTPTARPTSRSRKPIWTTHTTSTPPPETGGHRHKTSTPTIIGIVVGCVVGVAFVGLMWVVIRGKAGAVTEMEGYGGEEGVGGEEGIDVDDLDTVNGVVGGAMSALEILQCLSLFGC